MALETRINHERTSCWVHGSNVHCALDFLNSELSPVIPMCIVLVLTYESNGALSIVYVESGHIEVINEVDQLVLADRSIDFTSSALKLLLENGLEEQ